MRGFRLESVFAASLLLAVARTPCAAAEVAPPRTPDEIVAMVRSQRYLTDLSYRAVVRRALFAELERRAIAGERPTDALSTWFTREYLGNDARRLQLFQTVYYAWFAGRPLDVYLLLGQSNMEGFTESGEWNGPDEEIRSDLQAATPEREVVTLNCSMGRELLIAFQPEEITFQEILTKEVTHDLTRECLEFARDITSKNPGSRVRGIFFFQGESDASGVRECARPHPDPELAPHCPRVSQWIENWGDRYISIIGFLRKELGNVPAVHAQLASVDPARAQDLGPFWSRLQRVQGDVVKRLPNSAMIVTRDLKLHDGIHLSDASQAIAGHRFAAALLELRGNP